MRNLQKILNYSYIQDRLHYTTLHIAHNFKWLCCETAMNVPDEPQQYQAADFLGGCVDLSKFHFLSLYKTHLVSGCSLGPLFYLTSRESHKSHIFCFTAAGLHKKKEGASICSTQGLPALSRVFIILPSSPSPPRSGHSRKARACSEPGIDCHGWSCDLPSSRSLVSLFHNAGFPKVPWLITWLVKKHRQRDRVIMTVGLMN